MYFKQNKIFLPNITYFYFFNEIIKFKKINFLKTKDINDILKDNHNSIQYFNDKFFFKFFFINNDLDVPVCFKKTKSLYKKNNKHIMNKYVTIFLKKGKKYKYMRLISKAFNEIKIFLNSNVFFDIKGEKSWLFIYYIFSNFFKNEFSNYERKIYDFEFEINPNVLFKNNIKIVNNKYNFFNYFLLKFDNLSPLFQFNIQKIDKNIRKYSRGKMGKYKLNWKYVPSYKRILISFRWFLKDVKFNKNLKFKNKMIDTLLTFFFNNHISLAYQYKVFIHKFVFKNFKWTLMENYDKK